ncbi:MAG: hypothetical protein NWR72_15885 [Bacteroidia bacterium]|nr:hypothetical protein [Bacteroidia bacterium]
MSLDSHSYTSADPRMNRIPLPLDATDAHQEDELGQWQTYEVFQQRNRGEQHVHVGSLHGPNPEMALILAKEQFGRREKCANLWVVRTSDVFATSYEDADMFQHSFDKTYRESDGYRVKDTIEQFTKDLDRRLAKEAQASTDTVSAVAASASAPEAAAKVSEWKAIPLPDLGQGPRKVLVKR